MGVVSFGGSRRSGSRPPLAADPDNDRRNSAGAVRAVKLSMEHAVVWVPNIRMRCRVLRFSAARWKLDVMAVPLWVSGSLYDDPRVQAAGNESLGYLIQCAIRAARQGRRIDVAIGDVTNDLPLQVYCTPTGHPRCHLARGPAHDHHRGGPRRRSPRGHVAIRPNTGRGREASHSPEGSCRWRG